MFGDVRMKKNDEEVLEKIVMARLMRLNAIVSGIVTGIIGGMGVFVVTLWLVVKGGNVVGPHLALLGQFFIGYKVTLWGSFVGFLYGFVTGFIIGSAIAMLYNYFLRFQIKE